MQPNSITTPYQFFASANSAEGFRSYFDEIFPSEKLDGIFILKGGPGTGKSTLLRSLAHAFDAPEIKVEVFYCSSDPSSLDGVLLSHGERRVAILDGTAPHERDARSPGATDVLVNLGVGFDERSLREKKSEIVQLQRKKGLAYKEAYFYLQLFGIFRSKIEAETKSRVKKDAIDAWITKEILPLVSKREQGFFSPRLIRSFSSKGEKRLDSYERLAKKSFVFCADKAESGVFLHEMLTVLQKQKIGGIYAPSPFSPSAIDGIFLEDGKIAITACEEEDAATLCSRDFFSPPSKEQSEVLKKYNAEAKHFLALAKEALVVASEHHFALEGIYTPAMHFDRLAPITAELKKQIASLLSIREIP